MIVECSSLHAVGISTSTIGEIEKVSTRLWGHGNHLYETNRCTIDYINDLASREVSPFYPLILLN